MNFVSLCSSLQKHITCCKMNCTAYFTPLLCRWKHCSKKVTQASHKLREWCVNVFILSGGDFILDQRRSKCGCRGGGIWPISLGTKEEIFIMLPGSRLWKHACISNTYPLSTGGTTNTGRRWVELTAAGDVLTCWVAAALWHGPAAQRLWMPL